MKRNNLNFSEPIRQSYVAILMIVYKYYKVIIRQLIPLILIVVVGNRSGASWTMYILYGVIGVAVVSMFIAIIAYFRFFFHIEGDELIVQKGILNKKRTSIPFDRIQTINLEQNIVHQVFGVVKVEVDTAGSNKSEFEFDALRKDMADDLRSLILSRKATQKTTDISAFEMEDTEQYIDESETILTIGVPQLIKIGITENHLRSGSLILIFGFWIFDNLSEAGVDVADYGEQYNLSPSLSIGLVLVAAFLVISIIISLARTVLRFYDLSFLRAGEGFRVTSGLLTRKNVAALDHKIQMISFSDNLLKKIFGYKDLLLKQASSVEVANKKSIKIPGCTVENIEAVTHELYSEDNLNNIDFLRVDIRYFIRQAMYIIIFCGIGISVAIFFMQKILATFLVLFVLYLLSTSYLRYRKTMYGFNHEMIIIKGGTFGDKTTLFPIYKLQSAAIKQNIYQRRKNLASLVLYTASGGTSIPYIENETAERIMNYVIYRVEKDGRKWM